jgi:hypothetical protein
MNALWSVLICISLFSFEGDLSMHGVRIHDTKESLDSLNLEVVSKNDRVIEYIAPDGNGFSVQLDHGKVVYMENGWYEDESSTKPLFTNFEFGKTSLRDVRNYFGNYGFNHKRKIGFVTATDLIMYNCFELDPTKKEVLVTISRVSLKEDVNQETMPDKLKLDAVIIADRDYLDMRWGKEKVYESVAKK